MLRLPKLPGLLLAGIISDTLKMISPTTTDRDREVVRRLSRWAFIPNSKLKDEDLESYAEKVLAAGSGLSSRPPEEIVSGDIKTYEAGGYNFAISQAEVSDFMNWMNISNRLSIALENLP